MANKTKSINDILQDLAKANILVGAQGDYDVVSSGSIVIDAAAGNGGFVKGRIIEVFGPESCGKTTMALSFISDYLKNHPNMYAVYLDYEFAYSEKYAKSLGINTENGHFIVVQPDHLEQGFTKLEELVETGVVGVAVLDSLASALPKAEFEGDYGDQIVGLKAKTMAQCLRKITPVLADNDAILVVVNHLIAEIGKMGFGDPNTTPGGKALKYYSTYRIKMTPAAFKKQGSDASALKVGREVKVEFVKNKVADPFRSGTVLIEFGKGFDNVTAAVNSQLGKKIEKLNATQYLYKGTKYTGFANLVAFFAGNKLEYDELVGNGSELTSFDDSSDEGDDNTKSNVSVDGYLE